MAAHNAQTAEAEAKAKAKAEARGSTCKAVSI